AASLAVAGDWHRSPGRGLSHPYLWPSALDRTRPGLLVWVLWAAEEKDHRRRPGGAVPGDRDPLCADADLPRHPAIEPSIRPTSRRLEHLGAHRTLRRGHRNTADLVQRGRTADPAHPAGPVAVYCPHHLILPGRPALP